jgi:protein-S-isoprenylcysteine O-methyltransferase Ste14
LVLSTRFVGEGTNGAVVNAIRLLGILGVVTGAALAIWAWFAMGLRRLRVSPQPAANIELVIRPPYKWIRHPMYSGLMIACSGLVLIDPSVWRIIGLLMLVVTLYLKATLEEKLLTKRIPAYAEYMTGTGRFFWWRFGRRS